VFREWAFNHFLVGSRRLFLLCLTVAQLVPESSYICWYLWSWCSILTFQVS